MLPGNDGLYGMEPLPQGSAPLALLEIINTANSRWRLATNQFFYNYVYDGYVCDAGCFLPYYRRREDIATWGYAPDMPAVLPFLQGST